MMVAARVTAWIAMVVFWLTNITTIYHIYIPPKLLAAGCVVITAVNE